MASLIEAIDIKRKMFFEYEGAPYHVLDVEVSRPTARGGQTLVRIKMRNLVTRAVFDKTFKAGEKFDEPDLVMVEASYLYADSAGLNFMDQESFETLTLRPELLGDDRLLLVDNLIVQVQKFNGNPIGVQFPPHVEMTVSDTEEGVRGNTASGSVTKIATLESGLAIQVPLFIKVGEKVQGAHRNARVCRKGVIFQSANVRSHPRPCRAEARERTSDPRQPALGRVARARPSRRRGGRCGLVVVLTRTAHRRRGRRRHRACGGHAGVGAERVGLRHGAPPRHRLVEDHRQGRRGERRGGHGRAARARCSRGSTTRRRARRWRSPRRRPKPRAEASARTRSGSPRRSSRWRA